MHCALLPCRKKARAIQYGYRKWGIRARVFSQTLAHGNKNEDKETEEQEERLAHGKKQSEHEKKEVPTDYHYLIKIKY